MRRAVLALPIAVLTAAGLVAGCSSPDAATTGPATSIVIGAGSEPENLNPVLGYAPDGAAKIFDGLVTRDASLAIRPALAAELPKASADGLTWTARLRTDITFSDGTPVSAQDVVFTYKSVLDKKVNSTIASRFDAVTDVVATGQHTVEFKLSYAYAPFVQQLTLGIVPAARFTGADINSAPFNTAPIGTGPYTVAEWRKGDRMVLRANEKYWGGAPAIKTVTVIFVPDDNARATRMAAGEFDGTVLPPKLARSYSTKSGYQVIQNPSADYRGLGLPSELPFTSDARVRRAINLGINRQAMIDTVLAGSGTPAATPISPHLADWYDAGSAFPHDVAEAEKLLDEAGWRKGADGKRSKDGRPARLPVLYPAPDVLRKELALAAASDIAKLGIDAPVEATTFDVMLQRQKEAASIWGGGEPYDPDTAAYTLLHSRYAGQPGYVNMSLYRNSTVDTALDLGRRSLDPAVRKQAYLDFQRAYVADPGWAFLVFLDHTYVLRDRWSGQETQVEPHDHGLVHAVWWNLERWTPKP
jgi:peptide/nickel transport system substrate-binding protein